MSKGNMLLGHARGKVGDLVFSRTNGQQVVRARAAVVKNPQTEAQMIQRIILNTVAQAYSRMSAITDHSFEGVQEGQKTMSAFLRKNINALRSRVSAAVADPTQGLTEVRQFSPIGTNTFALNSFVIASGSLPAIDVDVPATTGTKLASIAVGGTTYGDIIAALGLQRGDQLTFIDFREGQGLQMAFKYARIILDPTNEDKSAASLNTPLLTADGAVNLPSPRNTGDFGALSIADGKLSFAVGAATANCGAAAVIVSRKGSDGNWMRSNTQLAISEWALVMGYSMQEALDLFEEGGFSTLNAQFLNNAGTGALATSGSDVAGASIEVKMGDQSSSQPTLTIERVDYLNGANNGGNYDCYVAYDANGKAYPVRCGDEDSDAYNKALVALTGNVNTAWADNRYTNPEGETSRYVLAKGLGDNFTEWLVNKGMSWTVFMAPFA